MTAVKDINYIICPICNKQFRVIKASHVKRHGLTLHTFKSKFPNQKLMCSDYLSKTRNTGKSWSLSSETKNKQRLGKLGDKNPQYGKPSWNKGLPCTEEQKKALLSYNLGKKQSKETITKRLAWRSDLGKVSAQKLKMRQAAVKRVLLNNGIAPSYNMKTVELFKKFDSANNTIGQYATAPNEFYIKELGYWVDYINFDLKLIIEVDEKHHFTKDGNLKERDVQRQKEIQEQFPDFKFLRFKDTEMHKILEIKVGII